MAAAAEPEHETSTKRRNSLDFLPPLMTEMRVVLLGNSWSEQSSVGNLIYKNTSFNPQEEPERCVSQSEFIGEKRMVVINTPNVLHPDIPESKLGEFVEDLVKLSDPGPHMFLLVLQPESFTEQQQKRLQSTLELYGDQVYNHMLLLIPDRSGGLDKPQQHPQFGQLMSKCKHRLMFHKSLQRSELFTVMDTIMKTCDGDHVTREIFVDAKSEIPSSSEKDKGVGINLDAAREVGIRSIKNPATNPSPLRIVVLGKSENKITTISKLIKNEQATHFFRIRKLWERRERAVTVARASNIFTMSEQDVRKQMKACAGSCQPGPNVLLLLLNPSEFTQEDRQRLNFTLSLFDPDGFKRLMIIFTHKEHQPSSEVTQLLQDCRGRRYNMFDNNRTQLMEKIENIVDENEGTFLTFTEHVRPPLNLVLFGRQGAGKTSAAKAILGRKDLRSVSDSPECVQNQGEVFGRRVSLVELPALGGKPPEEVMEESFNCVSLCEPEGVHAFVLVLPVGPLTDDDKRELQTIQNTFRSRVNDFTMILFTLDSDPTQPDVNFVEKSEDIQELRQSCGGGSLIFNVKSNQQVPELLDAVEKINQLKNFCSYSAETFMKAQIERVVQEERDNTALRAKVKKLEEAQMCDEEQQSSDCLRIVLIGKTGCGKSSSGNTILGRKAFKAESKPTSVTKRCQKEVGEVDGRAVALVDTPGLFDSTLSHDEVNEEMLKCISLLSPGPHVFLVVVQIGRFTPEEKETLKLLREAFGKNSEQFTIILFTNGDRLEHEEKSVEDFIREGDDSFQKLIDDCGGRFHVFNNYDKNNRQQVGDLIIKIDDMLKKNKGNCYTNEMLQEAEAAIKKEMERILQEKEEEIRKEKEELKQKHEEEMQEMKIQMEEEREKLQQQTELKLKEMKENIKKELEEKKREQEKREEERRKRERSDEEHRQILNKQLETLDEQIQSEKEEKKSVNRELELTREEKIKDKEDFEKERKELVEKQKKEDEERQQKEQKRLEELEEQYKKEKEKYEKKMKEEENIRRKNEEKEKKQLEEKLDNLQKKCEDEVRKMAEEKNEFQEKYKKKLAGQEEAHKKEVNERDEKYDILMALKEKNEKQKRDNHRREINKLVEAVSKNSKNLTDVKELLMKHEREMKEVKEEEKEKLQETHESEMSDMIEKFLNEIKESQKSEMKESPPDEIKESETSEKKESHPDEIKESEKSEKKESHPDEKQESNSRCSIL